MENITSTLRSVAGLPLSYAREDGLLETASILRLLQRIIYMTSNSLLDIYHLNNIVEWIDSAGYVGAPEKILRTQGPSIEIFTSKLFLSALSTGNVTVARALLRSGVSPNSRGRFPPGRNRCSALYYSLRKDHRDMARLLLTFGADPTQSREFKSSMIDCLLEADDPFQEIKNDHTTSFIPLLEILRPVNAAIQAWEHHYRPGAHTRFSVGQAHHSPCLSSGFRGYTNLSIPEKNMEESSERLMRTAIGSSDFELTGILLSQGLSFNDVLSEAIKSENHQTAKAVLSYGVRSGLLVSSPYHDTHIPPAFDPGLIDVMILNAGLPLIRCLVSCYRQYCGLLDRASQFTPWVNSLLRKAVDWRLLGLALSLVDEGADASSVQGLGRYEYLGVTQPYVNRTLAEQANVILEMVELGMDINSCSTKQDTIPVLCYGIEIQDFAIVKWALDRGADASRFPPQSGWSPLHSTMRGYPEIFASETTKALISQGADMHGYELICTDGGSARPTNRYSASKIIHRIGRWLMTGSKKGFCFTGTPFQAASFWGSQRAMKILLKAGADQHAPAAAGSGFTALQAAAFRTRRTALFRNMTRSRDIDDCIQIVEDLIRAGADINAPAATDAGFTALQIAILEKNTKLIEILLDKGADIHCTASKRVGCTALQAAAAKGNVKLVMKLLQANVDVNAAPGSEYGRTALQAACFANKMEIAEALLDRGADVNYPPCRVRGATALQYAAMNGNLDLVVRLLEMGADINGSAAAVDGRTALEAAAENGRLDIMQLLLQENTEPESSVLRAKCDKAASLAQKQGHETIANILREWKASSLSSTAVPEAGRGFVNPQDLLVDTCWTNRFW